MKLLAGIGLLFWVYCAVNITVKAPHYLSDQHGRIQFAIWWVIIFIGTFWCLHLLTH